MQTVRLIDRKPRLDPRLVLLLVLALGAGLAVANVAGRVIGIEDQVLGMVIVDIMLLTGVVCFYDLTFAVILWFYALTLILRYTQLNLPGIPDMSGPRFMLVVMWGVLFLEVVLRRRRLLGPTLIEWLMLLFVAVHFISMIHHQNLTHTAKVESPITSFMNFVVFPFSVYYMVRNACSSDRSVRRLFMAFAILQVYLALTGILEKYRVAGLVFPPDILDPTAGGGRWFGARIRGPYLHTPIYGATMSMGFYLALHYFNYVRGWLRWALLVGLVATPLACLYTLTRQVWLGWLLPLFAGIVCSSRQRVLLAAMVLVGLIFTVMVDWSAVIDEQALKERASNEVTGESRIGQLVAGTYMFLDRPILGSGLGSWQRNMESYRRKLSTIHTPFGKVDIKWARGAHAHNTFLRLAVELGVIGLLPYVLIFALIFRKSWQLFRRLPADGLYGRGMVLAFWQLSIAFLICINFVDPSFGEFMPGFFYAWAAIIVRRAELAELEAAGLPVPPGHTLARALAPESA